VVAVAAAGAIFVLLCACLSSYRKGVKCARAIENQCYLVLGSSKKKMFRFGKTSFLTKERERERENAYNIDQGWPKCGPPTSKDFLQPLCQTLDA